ncbi:MAG TPA: WecB/TagA/CpsF family glycosyltransferase [Candidatus Gracilibacteria bacterium]|nr:WecB/TagA/CpsF family glycosyltransferase [Candidatus Gracilibacteria bacterium]
MRKSINILGVNFDVITSIEAVSRVDNWLSTYSGFFNFKKQYLIVTPNPEIVLIANKNPEFMEILNSADMSIPDGIGILWASKFKRITEEENNKWKRLSKLFVSLGFTAISKKYAATEFPERVTGVDLMDKICAMAAERNHSIFLLGAEEGVAEKTAVKLIQKYPKLKIAGVYAGTPNEEDEAEIVELINSTKPGILFVAYGAPKQEFWITRNMRKLESVRVGMGVGGSFDFISGTIPRAPMKLRKAGLEWLYRLYKQPSRVKRIWNAVITFPVKIFKNK